MSAISQSRSSFRRRATGEDSERSSALFLAAFLLNSPAGLQGQHRLIGKILGHRGVTTTQRYLHPEIEGIAEIVNEVF